MLSCVIFRVTWLNDFFFFFTDYDTGFSGLGVKMVSVDVSLSPIVAPAKTVSQRDEIAYFADAISNAVGTNAWRGAG